VETNLGSIHHYFEAAVLRLCSFDEGPDMVISPTKALKRLFSTFMLVTIPIMGYGQQPFVTDDADVTARRKLHFEFSNQFDILQRSLFPNLRQNTADFELDYGLFEGLEVGIESPLIGIFNARTASPRSAAGVGDTNLAVKYNLRKERLGSEWPAIAFSLNVEFPTGDSKRQLGSALTDFWLNGILQKSITTRTKTRLNAGVLFAGNTTTGVIGIKTRGTVFTGGASVVRNFTDRLDLGAEVTGAVTSNLELSAGQLQGQFGGNYRFRKNCTLDFGLVAGRYSASPRVGAQLGVSIDF
jgi:hypothetical protein